jgi:hypothetical protein
MTFTTTENSNDEQFTADNYPLALHMSSPITGLKNRLLFLML